MRIYKHPQLLGWILAVEGVTKIEIARGQLPADPAEALVALRQRFDQIQTPRDEDGNPLPPPIPPQPEPELDLDDEAVQVADFEALAELAATEIEWLEATIPNIYIMSDAELRAVIKRLAQENLRCIKAWLYVFRKLI